MSDHATQPDLFAPDAPDAPRIAVTVTYRGRARYRASIANGWWIADGYTEKEAIQNVVKLYEQEMSKND